jgi:heat shock protein HslJ
MKSKTIFLILLLLFSPVLTLAQTNNLQGEWRFLTLKANGENISLPNSIENHSIRFNKDGKLFSSITCNNFSGKYSLGKQRKIKISSLLTTMKGCFDEEAKIEQSFASILKKITKYQIKDSVLTLQDESGMNVVSLTKE